MIDGALRAIALLASALIALSFVLFAVEEGRGASNAQQSAVVDPGGSQEKARAAKHTKVREVIDDVNDELLSPFAGVVGSSGNSWVRRGVPAVLGLLVYGLGLGYLARLLDVRSRRLRPARTATAPPGAASGSKPPPAL